MKKFILLLILLIAFTLRFYKLGSIPRSLDWDEVSNGYNAYSILKTARDEYGSFLPLTSRSFDDFKPPVYMYLTVPSVAVFGLTSFAVRLPSALLGVATIYLVYLLTKRLFKTEEISLLSAFLLAISPWHLQFSRVGFEATAGVFFSLLSFTLLLWALDIKGDKAQKESKILLILAAISFGISFYSYHSIRIFSPLLLIATLILFRKNFLKFPKLGICLFFLIPIVLIVPSFIRGGSESILKRYETTSMSSRQNDLDRSVKLLETDKQEDIGYGNLIHNRRIVIAQTFLKNYLVHFDLNYLFTKGDDNFRHHIENMGMLYLFELPLILFGIYLLIKEKTKEAIFILFWVIFSPLAAAPTNAVPHAVRSFTMIIGLEIMSALGFIEIFKRLKSRRIFLSFSFFVISTSLLLYLHNYYNHYPKDHAESWQYGYKQAVEASRSLESGFEKVIIDPSIEQGYAYWLFYTKYDPASFQTLGSREHFDKYYFQSKKPEGSSQLFVSTAAHFPQGYKALVVINFPSGKEAIKIGNPL